MNRQSLAYSSKQQGATLVVALLILLVLTIIGITAMQTNIMEERMAGNSRDVSLSLQAAEAALREAEEYIETIVSPAAAFDGNTAGLYPDGTNVDVFADATWDLDNVDECDTNCITYGSAIANVTHKPRYIIELVGEIGSATTDVNVGGYGESSGAGTVNSFRITARGTGGSDSTVTMLQTYYAKRF